MPPAYWPCPVVSGGGCLPRSGCLLRGCIPACNGVDTPLWTEWLTDRCKNITLPQTSFAGGNEFETSDTYSLRTVLFSSSQEKCSIFNLYRFCYNDMIKRLFWNRHWDAHMQQIQLYLPKICQGVSKTCICTTNLRWNGWFYFVWQAHGCTTETDNKHGTLKAEDFIHPVLIEFIHVKKSVDSLHWYNTLVNKKLRFDVSFNKTQLKALIKYDHCLMGR